MMPLAESSVASTLSAMAGSLMTRPTVPVPSSTLRLMALMCARASLMFSRVLFSDASLPGSPGSPTPSELMKPPRLSAMRSSLPVSAARLRATSGTSPSAEVRAATCSLMTATWVRMWRMLWSWSTMTCSRTPAVWSMEVTALCTRWMMVASELSPSGLARTRARLAVSVLTLRATSSIWPLISSISDWVRTPSMRAPGARRRWRGVPGLRSMRKSPSRLSVALATTASSKISKSLPMRRVTRATGLPSSPRAWRMSLTRPASRPLI